MRTANRNLAWAAAWIDELAHCGVRHAVVSPGSRSAPLALALASDARIATTTWLDERAAGFHALGLARAAGSPVVLVCTSGTAAANYLPAIVEAHHSGIPLIALTADRPPEHRDCGAGQAIDQYRLFGDAVRWFVEAPLPEPSERMLAHARTLACRSVAAACGSWPGPVHVNLPFREPLDPSVVPEDRTRLEGLSDSVLWGRGNGPWLRVAHADDAAVDADTVSRMAEWIGSEERGWIVAGPLEHDAAGALAIAGLARAAGWPLLADPLSQLRCGPHDRSLAVDAYDALLRSTAFTPAHAPRRVLRFGAMPTSKAFRQLVERDPSIEQVVVGRGAWLEPTGIAHELLRCAPGALAQALTRRLQEPSMLSDFARTWIEAGRSARRILTSELAGGARLSEPAVIDTLARHTPGDVTLYVASSMPIRDVDGFWPSAERRVRFVSNRGTNGIDGTLACALGTAAGSGEPCIAVMGDLALLHDIGSARWARSANLSATVIVIDNDGGGIFEFLPVATRAERAAFDAHFTTPHGADIEAILRGFGLVCTRAETPEALRDQLQSSLVSPGVQFIRVPTDRRENRELHAKLFAAVAAALIDTGVVP